MKFIKRHSLHGSSAVAAEAEGLEKLREFIQSNNIMNLAIPKVLGVYDDRMELEYVESFSASEDHMMKLGAALAKMHRIECQHYGYESDNFIGLNPQPNYLTEDWGTFFFKERLCYQVAMVRDTTIKHRLYDALVSLEPALTLFLNQNVRHPSLVHGDLWSGNVLFNQTGCWLIDPAIYFADREVDLAMTELFGGFSKAFYRAYDEHYPRTDAYSIKATAYNLYHYLNHYNLFGDQYLTPCFESLTKLKHDGV